MLRGVIAKVGSFFACICLVLAVANTASAVLGSEPVVSVVTSKDNPTVNVNLNEASCYGSDMSVTCYAPGYNGDAGIAANSKYIVYLDQVKASAAFSFMINTAPVAGEYRLVLGCNGSKFVTTFEFGKNLSYPTTITGDGSVPTGVKAAQSAAAKVKVSWSAVSGAKGYDVYRSASATKNFVKVGSATGTSYTDKKVKAGKTYYYKVSVTGTNKQSAAAKVSVLSAPKVVCKAGRKSVTVSWKKIKNAKGYKVYISNKSKKGYKVRATIKGNAKTKCVIKKLKSKKTYYIKVAAYTGSGKKAVVCKQSAAVKVKVK